MRNFFVQKLTLIRPEAGAPPHPVEMANEGLPNIWRLRETQSFVADLRREPARLPSIADLVEVLNRLPRSRWTDLIAEGIAALARELADKSMSVPDLVEWFAEWARDTRGEQRGLLLLTAHRAKGLEFDDVVILDGNWEAPSSGEDDDAPRRLFYVAMTRARRSLTVMAEGRHPFLERSQASVLHRRVAPDALDLADRMHRYQMPDMKLVDLSWAGRLADGHPSLSAIAEARVGDAVTLVAVGDVWTIQDARGRTLGRMSRAWAPPEGRRFLRGEVGAIVRWRKADNKEEYRTHLRRDEWEAVLPELVFG